MNARWLLLFALVITAGCGGQPAPRVVVSGEAPKAAPPAPPAAPAGVAGKQPAGDDDAPQRKIIQTANLDVEVPYFDKAYEDLRALLATHKVIIAKSEFSGSAGTRRTGTWTLRVPAESFQAFVDAVIHLGKPSRHSTDAQDVTEEYVDLEARINNLKAEEETLNALLKKSATSTADLLAFRQQISDIRGQIERAEARLHTLSRLAALSTVHLSMREEEDYVPPPPPNAPTFSTSVQGTWEESLGALSRLGKQVALIGVALTPWLPLLAVTGGVLWWVVRRVQRSTAPILPSSEPTPPPQTA